MLVFIEHGTRRMHLGGVTARPTSEWTVQQARNLALDLGEKFGDIRLLILILILNKAHLRAVLAEYEEHYNAARPHQGIGQRVPGADPGPRVTAVHLGTCQTRRKPVLSGLINEYERAA